MHDESHVRPVDPHPERNRGDDDIDLFTQEGVLVPAAFGFPESRVVGQGGRPLGRQPSRQRIDLAPRAAVDDAGFLPVTRQDVEQLPL